MTELKLRISKNELYGIFNYDEHIDKNSVKNAVPLRVAASEKNIQDLLNTLNKRPKSIERICFSGNNLEFVIKDKMKVVLKNRKDFKKNPNFKFLFDEIRKKRYKIIRKAITEVTMISVITVSGLIVTPVVNAIEGEFNKDFDNEGISLSDLSIGNEFLDRKFDIKKQNSLLMQKLEEKSKRDKISVAVRPKEEREKEALEKFYRSIYKSKEEKGFVITIDNKTYDLSQSDIELLIAIVTAECDKTYDDALAVISVILNRCESIKWKNSYGTNPVSQATAPNQFVVYQEGLYKKYMNFNVPEEVQKAVNDALNGVRNNGYLSFRSKECVSYSDIQITDTGNRYR